ncbi:plastocyanin/azurin family copper-binding protein [Chitinophaga sp. MM2321]|uniref:plastocyanin/azurin family copper-binding protein n=1 Tax=Chitinophaga sp. MM2321 TaxID=3137178 RepID=UPI0032D5A2D3
MKSFCLVFKTGLFAGCALFFLYSCGSGDHNKTSTATEATTPKTDTVEIAGMKFTPAELTVHKGDKVVFINHDMVTHDITEEVNKAWTSAPLPVNESWSLIVTQSADYFCSIHPVMKGKIIVQ